MVDEQQPVSMFMSTVELSVASPGDSLASVWHTLGGSQFQHIPVLDGDDLVGLISSWDLAERLMEEQTGEPLDAQAIKVTDIMETRLVTIGARQSLREAAELLVEQGFHSLPVVDDDGRLIGIVTSTDVINAYLGRIRKER
ncbi:MAG: CBS domain-containing protein [Myxococcales bacterium]|nr:CBS domain-containing protein [Myxococcales bacterium]